MKNVGFSISRAALALLALITLAGVQIWEQCTPFCADDFYYRMAIFDDLGYDNPYVEDISSLSDVWTSIVTHCQLVNGRLSNFIYTLGVLIPRPLIGVLMGLLVAWLPFAIVRCVAVPKVSKGFASFVSVLLMWTVFPWYDNMYAYVFQANYVLPSILVCLALVWWSRLSGGDKWELSAYLLYCIFIAWVHEGFGAVLAVWSGAQFLIGEKRRLALIATVGLLVGIGVNIFLGTALRIDDYAATYSLAKLTGMLSRIILQPWSVYLATLVVLFTPAKFRASRRFYIPYIAASYAGIIMAMAVSQAERALWPAELFSLFPMVDIIGRISVCLGHKFCVAFYGIFLVLYSLWLVQLCEWTHRIQQENRRVEEILTSLPVHYPYVVYADLTPADSVPWYLKNNISQPLQEHFDINAMATYYLRNRKLTVFPADFKGLNFESWPEVPGDAEVRGRWPVIALKDSVEKDVVMTFGPATDNMPLSDRVLAYIKGVSPSDTVTAHVPVDVLFRTLPDGTQITVLASFYFPRTLKNRPLLRVDLHK